MSIQAIFHTFGLPDPRSQSNPPLHVSRTQSWPNNKRPPSFVLRLAFLSEAAHEGARNMKMVTTSEIEKLRRYMQRLIAGTDEDTEEEV